MGGVATVVGIDISDHLLGHLSAPHRVPSKLWDTEPKACFRPSHTMQALEACLLGTPQQERVFIAPLELEEAFLGRLK